jgi:Uma2 family endonuclease
MGMTVGSKLHWITPEEYLASEMDSPVKHEYWNGEIYAMVGGTNTHQLISGNIYSTLDQLLRDKPCRPISSDIKIRIKEGKGFRYYYPDGGIICDENPRTDHFQDKPVVIFEVLSVSTRRADLGEKRLGYQSIPSLQSYLLVEQDQPAVIHYQRTKTGFRRTVVSGLEAELTIAAQAITLPLAEVYRRVSFAAE